MIESLSSPASSESRVRATAAGEVRSVGKVIIMSKARYSIAHPGPVAQSFSRYASSQLGIEISEAQAQAFFSHHNEWQSWRNTPGGEAEQEKSVRDAQREAATRETQAERIAKAQALLESAGMKVVAPKAS